MRVNLGDSPGVDPAAWVEAVTTNADGGLGLAERLRNATAG
jgi:hypothetical protein